WAAAHAGLALGFCAQAQFRMAPFSATYAEAKAAALRALAMDPYCAAAQTALGAVLFFSEWDWLAAERSLQRGLELDPEQTEAYLLYGQLLEAFWGSWRTGWPRSERPWNWSHAPQQCISRFRSRTGISAATRRRSNGRTRPWHWLPPILTRGNSS